MGTRCRLIDTNMAYLQEAIALVVGLMSLVMGVIRLAGGLWIGTMPKHIAKVREHI